MGLSVGAVVGSLEIQDTWSSTLQTAAANQQAFEAKASASLSGVGAAATSAGVQVSSAGGQMVAAAIAVQTRLALAESAATAAGAAQRTLADAIVKAGTASEAEVAALTTATTNLLAYKGAVASAKDELAALRAAEQAAATETATFGIAVVSAKEGLAAFKPAGQSATEALDAFGGTALKAGTALSIGLSAPLLLVGGMAAKLGIDAVESRNLIEVSFGGMTAAADAWAAQLSKDFGLNRFETEKTAGVLFTMTTSMGLGRDASFQMSTGVVKLAADMASFRNIGMDEALTKIKAGLVGESEPLKAIGVLVDENTVKTYAYAHGIATQGTELSNQQKVLARYGVILQQTSNDQGDLGRTLDSPANQLRIMKSRVEEAATSLGIALMPTIEKVIGGVAALVPYLQSGVEWFAKLPGPVQVGSVALLGVVAAAGPVLVIVGSMATGLAAIIPLFTAMGIGGTAAAVGVAQVGVAAPVAAVGVTSLETAATGLGFALGVLGQAVLVVGVAFAAWKLGTWLGEATGLTDWVERTAGRMQGLSTAEIDASMAARKASEAHAAATPPVAALAAQTGVLSDALQKEADAQKAAAVVTAEKARIDGLAKEALKAYQAGMVEIASAGNGWRGTLQTMSAETIEAIKWGLQAGVSQGALADAMEVSATQVRAVASSLKAATDATTAFDAASVTQYTNTIKGLEAIAKARIAASSGNYAEQIAAIEALDAAEQKAARAAFARMDDEVKRKKILDDSVLQHMKNMEDESALQLKLAGVTNAAVIAELDAQTKLNASWGLDASGALALQKTALDIYLRDLATLHAAKVDGISQSAAEQNLLDAYTGRLSAAAAGVTTLGDATVTSGARQVGAIAGVTQAYYAQVDAAMAAIAAASGGLQSSTGTRGGTPNDGSGERGPGVNQGFTVPVNGGINVNPMPLFKLPGFSFKEGGPTGAGGPATLHPDEYVVPKDGALVMRGGSRSAVTFQPGAIVIQGSVLAERDLQNRLEKALTKKILQSQQVS